VEIIDYTVYSDTIRAHIEAMRHTPPYQVINWRPFKPMRETSIQQMEKYIEEHQGIPNFHILPAMRPFYQAIGGWELTWVYHEPSPIVRTTPIGQSFLSGPSTLYAPVDEAEHDLPYDEGYRVFDRIAAEEMVVLKFQRGVDEPEFYLHHVPSDTYHPLALDFPTYMDLLLQTRALYPWQQFFVTTPDFRIDKEIERAFFVDLARLFPDADASRFRR